MKEYKNNKYYIQFQQSMKNNDLSTFKSLLNHNEVNPAYEENWIFNYAVEYSMFEFCKLLIKDKRVCPKYERNFLSAGFGGFNS
jgi:hypothetical protein